MCEDEHVSGLKGFFFLENFLIIENRVSIAGYHKKLTAMNGHKYSDLFTKVIINMEKAIARIYSESLLNSFY